MKLQDLGYKYTVALIGKVIKNVYIGGNENSPFMWIAFENKTAVKLSSILGILVPVEQCPEIDHEAAFALNMIDYGIYVHECHEAERMEDERKRQFVIEEVAALMNNHHINVNDLKGKVVWTSIDL